MELCLNLLVNELHGGKLLVFIRFLPWIDILFDANKMMTDSKIVHQSSGKVGVNPDILKNRKCRNFQTLTIMYLKVYIYRMEMSQRIYFRHQN